MSKWDVMNEFIAVTHGANHVLRNKELFEWFFLRNDNPDEANVIVAYDQDKLVSLLGYIPSSFYFKGEVIYGAWMAHWMTLESYRNGIGALLMRKITEMYPISAGQGASMMNQQIVKKMGFKFLENIPKVVKVFNPHKISSLFGFKARNFSNVMSEIRLQEVKGRLTPEIYAPDWRLYPAMEFSTLRDLSYLNHRFIDYPFMRYHLFILGPAISPAVCVCRIIDAMDVNGVPVVKVGRILEFFYPETEAGTNQGMDLLRGVTRFLKEKDCDYIDFYCTKSYYIDFFHLNEFESDGEGELPSLLDPVDTGRKTQNFELYLSKDLHARFPRAAEEFFVSRADGDQDRPNKSYQGIIR